MKSKLLMSVALFVTAPALAHAQSAQQPAAAPESSSVTEIVVTANRRAERLSDVPASITALGAERLQDQHVSNMSDLTTAVPNLHATSPVGDQAPIFALRGISMTDYSLSQSGPVATYINEDYIGNFAEYGVSLFDVDRIEVLRGPQGTLYGRNSPGGAINIITARPEFDTSGYLTVGFGDYGRKEANGAFNTHFGDTLAVRAAFTTSYARGWFRNLIGPDLNGERQIAGRVSVLWTPSDRFDATLYLSSSYLDPWNDGILAAPGPLGVGNGVYAYYHNLYPASNPNLDYFRTGLDNRTLAAEYTPRRKNRTLEGSLHLNWKAADGVTLTSVTAANKAMLFAADDDDGSPLKALEIPQYDRVNQITEDLRVTYDRWDRLKLIVGGYASREWVYFTTTLMSYGDIDANGDGVVNYQDCADTLIIACNYRNSFDQEKTSLATYGDAQFKLTSNLTLRGGIRYTDDRGVLSDYKAQLYGVDGVLLANTIPGSLTDLNATTGRSFHNTDISGKLGLDYKTDGGTLFYATLSRGYRGSGFNAQALFFPGELTIARPEVLKAAEIGTKTQLFDRRLQLSVSGFYYKYDDQQFINVDPITTEQQLLNLPKSQIVGAEVEFTGRPVQSLTLSGGVALLSSKILVGTVNGIDVAGHQLANAPKVSFSLAGDWDAIDAPWGQVRAHLDGALTSKQYFDPLNNVDQSQPLYAMLNGRLVYKPPNRRLEFALWAKNITNTFYYTDRISIAGYGINYQHVGDPRTFGGTVTYRY